MKYNIVVPPEIVWIREQTSLNVFSTFTVKTEAKYKWNPIPPPPTPSQRKEQKKEKKDPC